MKKLSGTRSLTQHLLGESSRDDLHLFFQWYLKEDVKAQLQFLARFSDKIPFSESEKYEWLFYKTIQMLRGGSQYLGATKQHVVLKIYEELFFQAADALALHHYLKTFHISRNGLTFIRLLADKERALHKQFDALYAKYLKLLTELQQAELPRELIQELINFVDKEERLATHMPQADAYSFIRLKIRLEYMYNGIESVVSDIKDNWHLKALKSSEDLSNYYFALFSEPWFGLEVAELAFLELPREVWKNVLRRLTKMEEGESIAFLWKQYALHNIFTPDRHAAFLAMIHQSTNV